MSVLARREAGTSVVHPESASLTGVARRIVPWAPVCSVFVIGIVRLSLPMGNPFSSGGDVAFIELQVRQAVHSVVGVGPYSRFGWHDPGPAMSYLFAPLYWLTGESSRSLFLSSWLLNLGSAAVAIMLIRRRAGVMAAWVAAFVLLLFVRAVGFDRLIDPWNPSILALPMLLVAVSAAAALDGDTWGLVVLAASGTFVMQTYIATVPVAALFCLAGASGYVWRLLRRRASRQIPEGDMTAKVRAARAGMIGVAALVAVAWALPIGQQIRSHPGNLGLLLKFELHPPAKAGAHHHSFHQAAAVVSDYGTSLGLGDPTDIALHSSRLAVACIYAVVGLAAALWWASRRNPFLAALAAATPVGLLVAVAAGTRVTGPIYSYMFWWCRMLPVPMLVALGVALGRSVMPAFTGRAKLSLLAFGFGTAVMAAAAVPALRTTFTSPASSFPDSPGARLVAHRIEAAVGTRGRVFTVQIADQGFSDGPLILTLAKDGYQFHLIPEMDLYSGDTNHLAPGPAFTISHGNAALPTVQPARP